LPLSPFTATAPTPAPGLDYPPTPAEPVANDYHGTTVRDPYRWLEAVDSPATRGWIEAQNRLTFSYLERIPERETIRRRLTALWNSPRYSAPFRKGGRYFYLKNDGLQNHAVLYLQDALEGEPRVLLDPNTLSPDGTVALAGVAVSEDGRWLAYGTSVSGSDWTELHVREIATGRDLPDRLQWVKFSGIAWTHDGAGFFYSRYPQPEAGGGENGGEHNANLLVNRDHRLYYHRLTTSQTQDRLIYARPDHPDWGVGAEVSADGRYLVLNLWLGTDRRNRLYYLDLGDPAHPRLDGAPVPLLDALDASYGFVGNEGSEFFVLTDLDAPRKRLVAIDVGHAERGSWRTLVPQSDDVLESARVVHHSFVTTVLHDAHSCLRLFALDGAPRGDLALPTIGSVSELSGEPEDDEAFFAFTSFLYPTTIFRHAFATGATAVWRAPTLDFDPRPYETRQVFVRSKDGTRVPMFVTCRTGLPLDASHPTYLYGYGGFNVSLTPAFSPAVLVWLEMGGVYALPNLRGGGEYGEEWHQGGMLERKQNVFDDFIAAAQYLIEERYTSPARLAIGGGSNGGLLVSAAMTQRPDLFGAVLPAVGVMDMLRFHRFTIGWAWVTEYGSADVASQFPVLYAYSPLHNLRPGTAYPATLITTADHDDRVVPGHSFKFAAALQAAQVGPLAVLIRIETQAGHGAGTPTGKIIAEQADRWAFLVRNLGMTLQTL
jgi:prolyl oligopeptidase